MMFKNDRFNAFIWYIYAYYTLTSLNSTCIYQNISISWILSKKNLKIACSSWLFVTVWMLQAYFPYSLLWPQMQPYLQFKTWPNFELQLVSEWRVFIIFNHYYIYIQHYFHIKNKKLKFKKLKTIFFSIISYYYNYL